jgi:hypothetical protein
LHLYAGTQKQNTRDAIKHGTYKLPPKLKGEQCAHSKLNDRLVKYIRTQKHKTLAALGKELGVHFSTIGYVRRREIWKHVK